MIKFNKLFDQCLNNFEYSSVECLNKETVLHPDLCEIIEGGIKSYDEGYFFEYVYTKKSKIIKNSFNSDCSESEWDNNKIYVEWVIDSHDGKELFKQGCKFSFAIANYIEKNFELDFMVSFSFSSAELTGDDIEVSGVVRANFLRSAPSWVHDIQPDSFESEAFFVIQR